MLTTDPAIEVVDAAYDGLDMLLKVERLQPDVVTLDVEMPRLDGLSALGLLMERFPRMRFGFVELSAQWVPYALHDFVRRMEKKDIHLDRTALMAENRIFVACQTDDDIAYVLKYAGPNNLVAGTDYGHADTSSELEALKRLRYREDVAQADMERILDANPRTLYGL